ncbi:TPM domain-containing protein [Lutibacter sp.]
MAKVEEFLSPSEEQEVIKAIKTAEKNTSGEIRVHIEKNTEKPPMERALEVFHSLEMDKTQLRNGVLFYIAVESKKFAILGDEGIDKKVPDNFWESTKDVIQNKFKQGNFKQGIIDGVLKAGEQLKTFFPYQADDTNELSDEISKG